MSLTDHGTIGKTVVEYSDSGRHIACLKKQLSDIGEQLSLLGQTLQDNPVSASSDATGIKIARPHPIAIEDYTTTVPVFLIGQRDPTAASPRPRSSTAQPETP